MVELWNLDSEPVAARAPRVLRSDEDANRVILLALPAGERLDEHQVHEHALVIVLDGEIAVRVGDGERRAVAHAMLHFEPAERHSVQAVSDARLLLCLAPWPGPGHPSRGQ